MFKKKNLKVWLNCLPSGKKIAKEFKSFLKHALFKNNHVINSVCEILTLSFNAQQREIQEIVHMLPKISKLQQIIKFTTEQKLGNGTKYHDTTTLCTY